MKKCSFCDKPLISIRFGENFSFVCDNWQCHYFRRPQGNSLEGKDVTVKNSDLVFRRRYTKRGW